MAILHLIIRLVCREGYFGPDCGCSPRNDSTGRFTCAANGTVVCLPGYQNPETNCTEVEGATQGPTTIETTMTTETTIMTTQSGSGTTNMEDVTAMETTATTLSVGMDIVPIVAGGVAGGLVLLVLILIVNIVFVMLFVRSKYAKQKTETTGNNNYSAIHNSPRTRNRTVTLCFAL